MQPIFARVLFTLVTRGVRVNLQAKRVTVYLARAQPDKLLDEMLTELQTVETLNCLIERTETPPYYRLTSVRKISGYGADPDPHSDQHGTNNELSIEKGTIHTKRHSSEEGIATNTTGLVERRPIEIAPHLI